jgi:FkbM family methyltransferase
MSAAGTIYDLGMHNGDDTEYYLKKGHSVIAVEANPLLCEEAEQRFAAEIAEGRLSVLNLAIAETAGSAEFYVKRERAPQSSLQPPKDMAGWHAVTVQTAPLADIVDKASEIAFMKIDIERMDIVALDSLIEAGVRPRLISAEAHSFEVLLKLYVMGYTRYRLVNGGTVHREHKRRPITLADGSQEVYRFKPGSSGPFGEDLPAPWVSVAKTAYTWFGRQTLLGNGWYDIHAA